MKNLNVVLTGLFYFLLIRPAFETGGTLFKLEFLVLLGLFGLAILGSVMSCLKSKFGTIMLFGFYAIGLLDLLYLMMNGYASFLRFLVVGLIGLIGLILLFREDDCCEKDDKCCDSSASKNECCDVEHDNVDTSSAKIITDEKEVEAITKEASGSVKKTFTNGKFIASKSGSTYHLPKCDWAKKINKRNRVWLVDEVDADSKGYKKHSCFD